MGKGRLKYGERKTRISGKEDSKKTRDREQGRERKRERE
jgi:hypothetical protein